MATELKYPDFKELQYILGISIESIAEYSASTTYAKNDIVYRFNVQFISLTASNTGNTPETSPANWMPWMGNETLFNHFLQGNVIQGSTRFYDDAASGSYEQWQVAGKVRIGGVSGKTYDAYKVHLDGTVVTGDADLVSIFDPGGAKEYPFIDLFAPDNVGTRTLLDYRGRVARSRDGGTLTVAIGGLQEDAFQGHSHDVAPSVGVLLNTAGTLWNGGSFGGTGTITNPISDGVSGTPRTTNETRVKSYSVGTPYIIVLKEI